MVSNGGWESNGGLEGKLDMKDPLVRYFLRHPSSRKKVPKEFLGKNVYGSRRTQREACVVGSEVRFAIKALQNRRLFMRAEAKRELQEQAKRRAEEEARLEAETKAFEAGKRCNDLRRELIKIAVARHKAKKNLRLELIKACASKPKPIREDSSKPFILHKADGQPCLVFPLRTHSFA